MGALLPLLPSREKAGACPEPVEGMRGFPVPHCLRPPPFLIFAHVSLSDTVRLNTGEPDFETGSTAK